jgi:hypothetical protein
LWCIIWLLLAANSPEEHNFISEKEKAYIIKETQESLSSSGDKNSQVSLQSKYFCFKLFFYSKTSFKKKTPWSGIFKSKVFYGFEHF